MILKVRLESKQTPKSTIYFTFSRGDKHILPTQYCTIYIGRLYNYINLLYFVLCKLPYLATLGQLQWYSTVAAPAQ